MADAFGGCASTASQFLMDDYRRPLLSSPLADIDTDATTAATVTLNRALALHQLAQCSSTVIPVSTAGWQFETLVYDAKRSHHSTAVTAAALHTALLPSRLHGRRHVSIHQQNAMLTRLPSMTVASLELGSPITVEDKYFNLTHSAQLAELPTVFGELVVQRSLKVLPAPVEPAHCFVPVGLRQTVRTQYGGDVGAPGGNSCRFPSAVRTWDVRVTQQRSGWICDINGVDHTDSLWYV